MTHWTGTLDAFHDAARWFAVTVADLDTGRPDDWHRPALGAWTRSDLVGHTVRALLTVEQYLAGGTTTSRAGTIDSYRAVRSSLADASAVAERGREAGRDLGTDRRGAVDAIVGRVVRRLGGGAPDARVVTPVGEWPLDAYLPTRVFELTVHTIDLRTAAGLAVEPPVAAAREALRVLGLLVADAGPEDAPALLRALTGRGPLPSGWSAL